MTTTLLLLSLAVLGRDALAAPQWSSPRTVASATCRGAVVQTLRVAENARGDGLLAWTETCRRGSHVVVARRRPHRRFGRPTVLASARESQQVAELEIALDDRGGAIVAWARHPSPALYPAGHVAVAIARPGRRFAAARHLDDEGREIALAGNGRGESVLAWMQGSGNPHEPPARLVASIRPPRTPRFGPPRVLSEVLPPVENSFGGHGGIHPSPAVAVADDGTVIAAWRRADGSATDCCSSIEASVRLPGGAFATAVPVAPRYAFDPFASPVVAVSDSTSATVAWISQDYGTFPIPGTVGTAWWDGRAFTPPATVLRREQPPLPSAFVGGGVLWPERSDPLVAWRAGYSECPAESQRFEAAAIAGDGAMLGVRMLAPGDRVYTGYTATVDARGRLVSAWFEGRTGYWRYGCGVTPERLGGAVDGGTPIDGPRVTRLGAYALTGAPAAAPAMFWASGRRILRSRLFG